MANNSSSTGEDSCSRNELYIFLGFYLLVVIMHIHIARVLISKLKLQKQMHKFLLSLSLADLFQMIIMMVHVISVNSMKSKSTTTFCHNSKKVLRLVYSMIAISCGSIIALSVERYIACLHYFRLHSILTKKRTIVSISLIWCFGLALGVVTAANEEVRVNYAIATLILITSAILIFVQARLFFLIRRRIHPGETPRATSRNRSSFLRQVKLNSAIFAVVVAFIACTLFAALMEPLRSNMSESEFIKARRIAFLLSSLNPVLDAFIYSIGIGEIWNGIKSDFYALKRSLLITIF